MKASRQDKTTLAAWLGLIGCLIAATYLLAPLLDSGFLTDDYLILNTIAENHPEPLRGDWSEIFHSGFEAVSKNFQIFRPTVAWSYALNFAYAGVDTGAYQLTNLLLHLFAGCLAFLLLKKLMPQLGPWPQTLACAWFLMSPLQLESVAWTAARSETLCWIFGASAWLWKLQRPKAHFFALVLAALSLCSKETGVTFLAGLLLIDLMPNKSAAGVNPFDRPRTLWQKGRVTFLGGGLILLAYLAAKFQIYGALTGAHGGRSLGDVLAEGLIERYFVALRTIIMPINSLAHSGTWRHALMVASALAFGAIVIRALNRRQDLPGRSWLLGALTFVVPFGLAVAFNGIDERMVNTRALYTPMFALCLLLVSWLAPRAQVKAGCVMPVSCRLWPSCSLP